MQYTCVNWRYERCTVTIEGDVIASSPSHNLYLVLTGTEYHVYYGLQKTVHHTNHSRAVSEFGNCLLHALNK